MRDSYFRGLGLSFVSPSGRTWCFSLQVDPIWCVLFRRQLRATLYIFFRISTDVVLVITLLGFHLYLSVTVGDNFKSCTQLVKTDCCCKLRHLRLPQTHSSRLGSCRVVGQRAEGLGRGSGSDQQQVALRPTPTQLRTTGLCMDWTGSHVSGVVR